MCGWASSRAKAVKASSDSYIQHSWGRLRVNETAATCLPAFQRIKSLSIAIALDDFGTDVGCADHDHALVERRSTAADGLSFALSWRYGSD